MIGVPTVIIAGPLFYNFVKGIKTVLQLSMFIQMKNKRCCIYKMVKYNTMITSM